ncbi:MAG: type III-A CRISPR-associated RAMP protein Csm5 [Thermodesulfobacteria bacterium]|nr:type III-A CRISPR-associated RAMP protein Csm5 [Thermodesulfobacteriota bacterium]
MKEFKIRLKTLTPIHIGTGEVYEPLSFFVRKEENALYQVDFEKLCNLISRSEKALRQFLSLAQGGNLISLIKLYKFFDKTLCNGLFERGVRDFIKKKIKVSPDFVSHYLSLVEISNKELEKISEKTLVNQYFKKFEIHRTAYLPNTSGEMPYIPGSSLKGAIRTAVLNLRKKELKNKTVENYKRVNKKGKINYDGKALERDILKFEKFFEDPFKAVKISDLIPVDSAKVCIVYGVNRKKDGTKARGPFQIFEVIEEGSEFEGSITIDENAFKVKKPLRIDEILEALKSFYVGEFEKERKIWEKLGIKVELPKSEGVLIRIGKHSGAESVTIEGFRKIWVKGRGGKGRFLPYSTTIWLASEDKDGNNLIAPFGWAVIKVLSEAEARVFSNLNKTSKKK